MKVSIKALLTALLSALLVVIPAGVIFLSNDSAIKTYAETSAGGAEDEEKDKEELKEDSKGSEADKEGDEEDSKKVEDTKEDVKPVPTPEAPKRDTKKPTFNAAVNDGVLTITAKDESGIAAIYVNGYEYASITDGKLTLRLKQFDAGYEYFFIRVLDNAGNLSDTEKIKNPYYSEDTNATVKLPVSVTPTEPKNATATVTDHTKTDANGNVITGNIQAAGTNTATGSNTSSTTQSLAEQKKAAMAEADKAEAGNQTVEVDITKGKEFYTIATKSNKTFYLVIDRNGESEKAYFLTEISENDLLNVTNDNMSDIPVNSVGAQSAIPNIALEEEEEPEPVVVEPEEPEESKKTGSAGGYMAMGVIGAGVIGGYFFLKNKKKDEEFLDEEDDEDDAFYDSESDDESMSDSGIEEYFSVDDVADTIDE